mgnify:CR=1 FL=1
MITAQQAKQESGHSRTECGTEYDYEMGSARNER